MPSKFGSSTNVTITSPLVLYRSWVATKRIDPDPAQHRLALHLQKLYESLKDYEPIVQYGFRLQRISRELGSNLHHANERNSDKTTPQSSFLSPFSSLFKKSDGAGPISMELTKVMTSHEGAMSIDSPRGLMVHGDVGSGKTMLTMDLLAASLPNRKKRRMHYTTFMLSTLQKLEALRRSRQLIIPQSLGTQDDYSLLWLARDMISTSPILFLDEFQFPDRAASKIMTNLMTCFFQLGGVLIATSNRMPEDLANAAGMQLDAQYDTGSWARNSFLRRLGIGVQAEDKGRNMFGKQPEFVRFLDVLRARCEIWEMESKQDYRRKDSTDTTDNLATSNLEIKGEAFVGLEDAQTGNLGLSWEQSKPTTNETKSPAASSPEYFLVEPVQSTKEQDTAVLTSKVLASIEQEAFGLGQHSSLPTEIVYSTRTFRVYGRQLEITGASNHVLRSTFADLCCKALGPADYITIASNFHTVILTDIPVFTTLMKNEARRFISLLDALYEAGCRLAVTAAASVDNLFFPQKSRSPAGNSRPKEIVDQDATYAETLSEVYQDAVEPFRPNVSLYDDQQSSSSGSRNNFANPLDQLEDDPPNRIARAASSSTIINSSTAVFSRTDAPNRAFDPDNEGFGLDFNNRKRSRTAPNFQESSAFTGDDERFAYKRAESRLWEMCSKRWWSRESFDRDNNETQLSQVVENASNSTPTWWKPLPIESRTWERSVSEQMSADSAHPLFNDEITSNTQEDQPTQKDTHDRQNISQQAGDTIRSEKDIDPSSPYSPFRTNPDPPPRFGIEHAWGVARWGRKAGKWGQGVDGIAESRDRAAQSGSTSKDSRQNDNSPADGKKKTETEDHNSQRREG